MRACQRESRGQSCTTARIVYLNTGDRARAEAVWHELAELAQRTKDTDLLLYSLANEIDQALLDGELEAAVVAATRAGSRGDELGAPVTGRQFASRGFRSLLYLNRAREALEALPEVTRLAGLASDEGFSAWANRSWTALALAHLGRSDEAQALVNQLLAEQAVATAEHVLTPGAGVILLETAVSLGDREAAALLASRLKPVAELAWGGLAATCVARHLGAAAALLGEHEESLAYYEQALEVAGKIRFRPEVALTHLGLAELRLGKAEDLTPGPFPAREGETKGSAATGGAALRRSVTSTSPSPNSAT